VLQLVLPLAPLLVLQAVLQHALLQGLPAHQQQVLQLVQQQEQL
jgi:hypothetical protein